MAVYKVPQDVEADDKLIGPFSFRQFIYLVIVALSLAFAWGLAHIAVPLVVIPMPLILFFGALALPLRKDQPMEVYMAAMVAFSLKPHKRFWDPDGVNSLIEITAPKIVEPSRVKDISGDEAERRFGYLASIVDSQGWAVRGTGAHLPNSAMNSDVFFEAQQIQDVLEEDDATSRSIDYKLSQSDARKRQEMADIMNGRTAAPIAQPVVPQAQASQTPSNVYSYFGSTLGGGTAPDPTFSQQLKFNPYPEEIRQAVIQPISQPQFNPYPEEIRQAIVQPLSQQPLAPQYPAASPQPQPQLGASPQNVISPVAPAVAPIQTPAQVISTSPTPQSQPQPQPQIQPQLQYAPTPVPAPVLTQPITTSEKSVSADIISLASNTNMSIEAIAREAGRIQEKQNPKGEVFIALRQ